MIKNLKYLNIFILLLFFFFNNNSFSLPGSFFLIEPSGIQTQIYTDDWSQFRIEIRDEDFNLPETANQSILSSGIKNGKNIILIQTGKNNLSAGTDLNTHLKNTPFLNTDRDDIKKAAACFRNSKDPLMDVSLFVYKHISDKKIGIPMAKASSILKQRAGDCTEHSILTAALLRSLKIPARAVIGLILTETFGSKKNVFVYHMWVEAYQKGKWKTLDSTRPLEVHPNRYIALAYHNLMTETPLEFLKAASAVNDMKIVYVR